MGRSRRNVHALAGSYVEHVIANDKPSSARKDERQLIFFMKMNRQRHIEAAHYPQFDDAAAGGRQYSQIPFKLGVGFGPIGNRRDVISTLLRIG